MDSERLVVPQNSRIDHSPGNELLETQNSPLPPSCTPSSCESRLSSTAGGSKRNGRRSMSFQPFKRHHNTTARTPQLVNTAADSLKSRLYDRAEDSEVYHRQSKPMPRPPPSSVPKERPTLYRTTLPRKNKAKAEPASEGVRWSLPDQKKENFQISKKETKQPKKSPPPAFHGSLDAPPPTLTTCDSLGPDQFQGQDILPVVKALRARLAWEIDPEIIINDPEANVNKEEKNIVGGARAIRKTVCAVEDDGQFAYATLKDLGDPTARYDPYNLVCIGAAQTYNLKQLFSVTASTVTQVTNNDGPDLTPMARWLYERKLFCKIFEIPVFAKFRQWKAFTTWKNNVRSVVNSETRDILGDMLFIADEIFQLSLLKVRRLCEEACGSLQREQASVFFVGEQFTDTLTLQEFVEACLRQADVVRKQLGSLRVSCQEISVQACQDVIARYEGMLEWIKSKRGHTASKPTFTQIAQWRGVLGKLSRFIRNVDFVVLELLRRLVTTAANTLLAKMQASSNEEYPWQHSIDEKGKMYDDTSENSPPAILTVKLVLNVPEPETGNEVSSTPDKDESDILRERWDSVSSKSSAGYASSRQSQVVTPQTFVDLYPSEEGFVADFRRVISRFQEVVSDFKSLLTDSKVRMFLNPPETDLVYSLTRGEEDENFPSPVSWPNVELVFGDDPQYQDTVNKLLTLVREEIHRVRDFSENYRRFCGMVDISCMVDVDSSMKMHTWTYEEFNKILTRHVEQVNTMNQMVISQRIGFFLIQVDSFRDSCIPYPSRVLEAVHYHLPVVASKSNNLLITIIKRFSKSLEKYPDSVEEFMERLTMQTRVAKELPQLEQEFLKVTKLYSLAISFNVAIDAEEMALYKTLMPSVQNLRSTLLFCEAKKDENIWKFSRNLDMLIDRLRQDLIVLRNKIRAPILIEPSSNHIVVLETLGELGVQLERIAGNARNYAIFQDHFRSALSGASRRKAMFTLTGSDEATKVDHAGSLQSDVAEVERDLSLRRLLWESSEQWSRFVKTWQGQPFENLNVEEMQKSVGKLIQTIYLLEKGLPPNSVVSGLKQDVTSFKQGMPAVVSLRNPALRSRHWEAVQTLIKKPFVRNGDFTLGVLLQMNVFQHKVKIAEISSHASNEYALEQMLRKVTDFWGRTDFNLVAHGTRDIALINGADEIVTALEDSLVTLANIKGSRFVAPIKALVEDWDRKLALFSLTLDEWLTCQRQWLYLESIFSASDIQRQLPNETTLFAQVDRSWKDIMRRTSDHPNALRAAVSPGVLEILQTCNTQLEKIHRCLEDYLETKRLVFARFYFLSNDELLDILSNSKDPHSIQPHLKKCFSNIRKLGIAQELNGAFQVHDMVSAEGECVALQKPVKIRGAIESWLAIVETAILGVIKLYLKQALTRSNQEFTKWIIDHPGQVVLTASQILFCRDVVACMESEDVDGSFREFHKRHLSTLSELVQFVMSPLLFHQRQCVEALLTIKVHERDTLKTLMQDQIHEQEDFQWKRQLRYRWHELNVACNVLQHNASFEYGYEYLGCSPRLVITPLTDRCYLTLTGALHLHLGGAPFGPAGTGKTETIKDLAKAMGKQCVVFNCSEGLDHKMTGKFFSGVAQSGSWFCFDEFNRIDLEVLSVIAQQLHTIKTAKDLELTWFVFEGRDIRLSRCCGVFITMNPRYAGRVELPDNVKSLYRPVAMMVPDYVLIAEIILFSEGFLTAVSLSRKVVNLYELIRKQLSQQDHYDFGLRSIKSMLLLAGQHKRAAQRNLNKESNVEKEEARLLLKAICSTNMPKFVTEDIPLFEQILVDLFPGLTAPSSEDKFLQKAINLALEELCLQRCPSQVEKVTSFHGSLLSRCGIALVGPTGGGKTSVRRILKEALSFLPILHILEEKYHETKDNMFAEITKSVIEMTKQQITTCKYVIGKKTSVYVATINPKCVNLSELYGEFNPSTMEWKDGLLSILFRKFAKESNAAAFLASNRTNHLSDESNKLTLHENEQSPRGKCPDDTTTKPRSSSSLSSSAWYWLVLDGPVDTAWVENLNTVLDDTKVLCLANGERISMGSGMRLIFEVDNLAKASPATVSRCAMVYVDPSDLGWKPYVKAWLEQIKEEHKISQDDCAHLLSLFDHTLDEGLRFQRAYSGKQLIQSPDLSIVTSLCGILAAFLYYLRKEQCLSPTTTTTTATPTPTTITATPPPSNRSTINDSTGTPFPQTSPDLSNFLSKLYLFAYTWSVGGKFVASVNDRDSTGPSDSDYNLETSTEHDDEEEDDEDEEESPRNAFDNFVRNLFRANPILQKILPPSNGNYTVFDYFFNLETEQFVLWKYLVPKSDVLIQKTLTQSIAITDSLSELDNFPPLHTVDLNTARSLVPTMDTIRYGFLLSLLLLNGHSVLLTGEMGVGKTILVEDVLLRLSRDMGAGTGAGTILGGVLRSGGGNMSDSSLSDMARSRASRDYCPPVAYSSMQCSARLAPSQVQSLMTCKLIKRGRDAVGAPPDSKVIAFMDDFNMPEPDQFGSQPPLELVREYLDQGGFYDTRRLQWIEVGDTTVVAACGPPTGGRHFVNSRVLRHFSFLFLPRPSVKALHRIFHVRLGRHFQSHDFIQEVREMCQDLVFATLSVFFAISSKLLPTPAKSHYTFNLKDVNKVIEGLLQAHFLVATTRETTALLFAHEVTRVFHDRLVDQNDRSFFHEVLVDKMDSCLNFRIPVGNLQKQPLIFGDFSELNNPKAERIYRRVKNLHLLSRTLQEYYSRLTLSGENFDRHFVFFRQAIEHISRAARVFRQPSGHLLLVGVGGTGKSSVVKLAAHLEQCDFKTLRSLSVYNIGDFREDVKGALCSAGIQGRPTVLFIRDKNLVKEYFLEDISYMLNGGEVPKMFNSEDKERIFLSLTKEALEQGIPNDKNAVFELFMKRVNHNIHLVVSTSPSGSLFRQRCRVYPSLINCCTIDWYDEWPSEALEAVGSALMNSARLTDSQEETAKLMQMLTKLSVDVHRSSQEAAACFFKELKRCCYATPSAYIECIQVFLKIFAQKQMEYTKYKERLNAGILKLDRSHELVGKMQQELIELGPELEQKAENTENLLNQLAKDQESVDQVRRVVSEQESVMNQEAKRVQEIADDAQRDLDHALPLLLAANQDLNALDKSDIAEVRVYTKPPAMVMTIMAAVCTILEEKTDWANTKQVLADPGFLKRLISFNVDGLSDRVYMRLKRFTSQPNFHPEHVERISVACRSMCQWVLALDNYAEIYRAVQPKKARCDEASAAFAAAKERLEKKQAALAKVEEQLQVLRKQYQESVHELESLHQRKHLTTQRLERASLLSKAFSEEHNRWLTSVEKLDESASGVIGDSFLSGATVAYLGAFSQSFRNELFSQWYQACLERDIPVSRNFDFTEFLTKPIEIKEWLSNSLPQDNNSIQSAVLVKNSRKWPLLIDPQRQALNWIAEMEKNNDLKIIKLADANCLPTLEEAVQLGKPVVITEIGENLDPRLGPVLRRHTVVRGNQQMMKISDAEVEYNASFRLYLATPLSNPQFFPEVFNKVTIINFTVTFEGLQDQLLSKVVYEERAELENKYVALIENLVSNQYKIRDLEDKCLDLLSTSQGNILDDEELVRTLEDSKNTARKIQRKIEQSQIAQAEIKATREHYLGVATRGAILYFTLVDLPTLDVMYQFSVEWFVGLFVSCLLSLKSREEPRAQSPLLGTYQAGTVQPLHRINKRRRSSGYSTQTATAGRTKSPGSLLRGKGEIGLEAHLGRLVDVITEAVYRRVTCGLFARHQTTFSFLLCCNILKRAVDEDTGNARIEKTEWNLFIWGAAASAFTERLVPGKVPSYGTTVKATGSMGSHMARMAKPPITYITMSMWQECMQLSTSLPDFSGLCSHIATNSQYWLDFWKSDDPYEFLCSVNCDPKSQESLTRVVESSSWSSTRLSSFQRLMLVKILRSERLLDAVRTFVKEHLGILYVSTPPVDLQEIFKESNPKVPIIFILSPGSDPATQLMRFARDIRGSTCQLDMISLGRGREARTEETITKSFRHRGRWVFLQNCHLASSFMPRLKEIVRRIANPAIAVESSFRLWLSSAPHPDFPVSILQAGTKIAVESSPGIKANILQAFASVGGGVTAAIFEDTNPGPYWKKLLFGLCLFNAVVHERKKFGALGWNLPYDFPNADLEVSISMLRMLLTEHENVPWQALRYLTAEVTYGGRVTDTWDKRCIINVVEKFYAPETLDDGYCYSSSKLYRPPSIEMTFSDCCDYIESLPSIDHPDLFGMQNEANRFCMQNEAKRLLDNLVMVHPHVDSVVGSGKTNDETVLDLVADIQKFLPQRIGSQTELESKVTSQQSSRGQGHPTSLASSNDNDVAPLPLNIVLRQEVFRFTRLLDVLHTSLNALCQSIHGQVLLSVDLEETYKSLLQNQVPKEWQKVAYSSSKPLASWINDLVQRTVFFSRWFDCFNSTLVSRGAPSSRSARSPTPVSARASHHSKSPSMPRAFWISAFFFPQGFFTSVLQRHARVNQVPVDSLKLAYEVTNDTWLPENESNERGVDVNKVAFQGSSTEDCVRIFGLYLDGAFWDSSTCCLAECLADRRFSALPEVKVLPVLNTEVPTTSSSAGLEGGDSENDVHFYECPLYSTPLRGDSFVLAVYLPTHHPSNYWITRGVALVSQLPE